MKRALSRGVSLLEVMVVVAIVGIVAGTAAMGFSDMKNMGMVREETRNLLSALRNARTLAVATSIPHGVRISGGADAAAPEYRNYIITYRKPNADTAAGPYAPGFDRVLQSRALPSVNGNNAQPLLIFDAIAASPNSNIDVIFDRNGMPQINVTVSGISSAVPIGPTTPAVLAIRHTAFEAAYPGVQNRSGRCVEMVQNGNTRIRYDPSAQGAGGCW